MSRSIMARLKKLEQQLAVRNRPKGKSLLFICKTPADVAAAEREIAKWPGEPFIIMKCSNILWDFFHDRLPTEQERADMQQNIAACTVHDTKKDYIEV